MDWTGNRKLIEDQFRSQGYVVIREFLNSQGVEELRREIERYTRDVVPRIFPKDVYCEVKGRLDTIKQLIRMSDYDDYFRKLILSERYVSLAKLLLDGSVVGKNMQWFNKPREVSRATPPHQDGYYFMLEPNEALTMWLALDEVDEDNGCVRYVSGSHLFGLRPHERTDTPGFSQGIPDYGPEDELREVSITARPGDLLIHHCLTIHRADVNKSNRTRRALGVIYYSLNAQEDEERLREYQSELAKQALI